MNKFYLVLTSISLAIFLSGCSSLETGGIKDWLKKGTKEHQENARETKKNDKVNLKSYLSKNGCISGSSAKIIETKDKNFVLYEVTCVTKSKKYVVKCSETKCSK